MDEETRALRGLEGICTYCERITHAVHRFGSKDVFLVDYAYQATCAFSLQQIGEIVKTNESWLRTNAPDFYWKGYIRFRDFAAHNYQNVDYDLLWAAVQDDVSPIWDEALSLIERFSDRNPEAGSGAGREPREGPSGRSGSARWCEYRRGLLAVSRYDRSERIPPRLSREGVPALTYGTCDYRAGTMKESRTDPLLR